MIDRLERLTTLVANLLATGRALSLEEIVELVPGYPDDKTAYRRQFERDKETLRGIGIPLSVEPRDGVGPDIVYRIRPDEYYLPELDLTADERAALHVAVTAVQLDGESSHAALWKLGGVEGEAAPALASLPTVPALAALFDAYRRRATVTFTHRGDTRTLDPWGIVFRRGHWYVVGYDHHRGAPRSFRADRVVDVAPGPAGAFEAPADLDPGSLLRDDPWRFGDEPPVEARVLVDREAAVAVEDELGAASIVERRDDGSVVVRLAVTHRPAFRSFVLGFLDHAEVLSPAELRADVRDWLRAIQERQA
ncbi:MAG: WYL domain-containing protein [Acidimicrobiia bacterium]